MVDWALPGTRRALYGPLSVPNVTLVLKIGGHEFGTGCGHVQVVLSGSLLRTWGCSSILEEPTMNERPETQYLSGVVCMFCGRRTPLPEMTGPKTSGGRRVMILRCHVCGKEAPYQASEMFEFQEEARSAKSATSAG